MLALFKMQAERQYLSVTDAYEPSLGVDVREQAGW